MKNMRSGRVGVGTRASGECGKSKTSKVTSSTYIVGHHSGANLSSLPAEAGLIGLLAIYFSFILISSAFLIVPHHFVVEQSVIWFP